MMNLIPQWLRRAPKGEEVYLMIPRRMSVLLLCGIAYGKRDPATQHAAFLSAKKSNCVFYALPLWLGSGSRNPERFLLIRRSRVNWGIFHMLYGKTDPATNQIAMWSYKPPPGHQKPGLRPVFQGAVIENDEP